MGNTVLKLTETGAGFIQAEAYSYRARSSYRGKKQEKSSSAQMKYNQLCAYKSYIAYTFENFNTYDWSISLTFPKRTAILQRKSLAEKFWKELHRLYEKKPRFCTVHKNRKKNIDALRYVAVWGRGYEDDKLHTHGFCNRIPTVSWSEIVALGEKLGIDVYVRKIRDGKAGCEFAILKRAADYLYNHNWTLTKRDRELFTQSWYPSKTRIKPRETREQDDKLLLNRLVRAYNKCGVCKTDFINKVENEFPDFKTVSMPSVKPDKFNLMHFSCLFIKRYSQLDCDLQLYEQGGYEFLLNPDTGEIFPSAPERCLSDEQKKEISVF